MRKCACITCSSLCYPREVKTRQSTSPSDGSGARNEADEINAIQSIIKRMYEKGNPGSRKG